MAESTKEDNPDDNVQTRLIRHRLPDRILHWMMAFCVLTLLTTSFLPILGFKFAWVTLHWIAGLTLAVAALCHIIRILILKNLRLMFIEVLDLKNAWQMARQILFLKDIASGKPGKYPLAQKLFHHAATLVILVSIVTGLLMMVRIDTPFWQRNPYWLSDPTWGLIYVLHGLASMTLVTFIMIHVYFAIRPENLWITRSMIFGWITRKNYLSKYDPDRWPVM
ncbi:MAG: cytochrome b/b6 domain-containing protein [Desulfobacterales bacterium]|nr:cytochrome b/b6 domain-containing protein [Desulfobacterales bacterium]